MFQSTKSYGHSIGLSCCFRQHRAYSHCNRLHGYALAVKFVFETNKLEAGWVVDFGGMKSLKAMLESTFDHKLLVAQDDPHLADIRGLASLKIADVIEVEATGCEAFAKLIYDCAETWLHDAGFAPRVWLKSVEVSEHGANSAIYIGDRNA
jgi:6-pyruvoyltetrahydropterin/6-carboxytetrahydropterin synthase